jgi:hypothetical protein
MAATLVPAKYDGRPVQICLAQADGFRVGSRTRSLTKRDMRCGQGIGVERWLSDQCEKLRAADTNGSEHKPPGRRASDMIRSVIHAGSRS